MKELGVTMQLARDMILTAFAVQLTKRKIKSTNSKQEVPVTQLDGCKNGTCILDGNNGRATAHHTEVHDKCMQNISGLQLILHAALGSGMHPDVEDSKPKGTAQSAHAKSRFQTI